MTEMVKHVGVKKDLVIIGGGPAGLAAAIAAREAGCVDLLLIERDRLLGGILNQCIHDGFGLHRFKEALSGPEYACRYIDKVKELGIPVALNTMVIGMNNEKSLLVSTSGKLWRINAKSVLLAMGCRERARGALSIPGSRPSGVYTAGAAQTFVNMENIMPGKRAVILGSGDVGLIMARRMTLEGARVEAVFELLPYSSGLPRNIQQCLVDYGIPLYLSTTVVETIGKNRLEGVKVAEVDCSGRTVSGTERIVPCDTLLLSVGLIPENELARDAGVELHPITGGPIVDDLYMTGVPGIFSCGNALHVHDLVDWVSEEAARAGTNAAIYAMGLVNKRVRSITVMAGNGVRYVMPRKVSYTDEVKLAFRVKTPLRGGVINIVLGDKIIKKETYVRLHPAEMVWMDLSLKEQQKQGVLEVRVGS